MLHEAFRYRGGDVSDVTVIVSPGEYDKVRTYAKDLLPTTVPVDAASSRLAQGALECLELRGELSASADRLVALISRQPDLRYLAVPAALVGMLPRCTLAPGLETIEITGTGRAALAEDFHHPHVRRIVCFSALLQFERESLPGIRHLHVQFDKAGGMRRLLAAYPMLESVTLTPTRAKETFSALPATLRYLRLIDGALATLAGISHLVGLTDLHLQNLAKLSDVDEVLQCRQIRDVSIGYCNAISRMETFCRLPKLERFKVYGSKINDRDDMGRTCRIRQLKELVLNP
jgi:hypothetical protein